MILAERKSFVGESVCLQMFVGLSVISQDGRHDLRTREILIAFPVLYSQFFAAIQLKGEFVYIHHSHLCSQSVGYGLEEGSGECCFCSPLIHDFCVSEEYLHIYF